MLHLTFFKYCFVLFAQVKIWHKQHVKIHKGSIYEKILFFFQSKNIFGVFILSLKLERRKKPSRQILTKYFEAFFLSFSIVSPHHKRNGTRLLSPQFEYIQKTEKKTEIKQKAFQLTRTFMCYMLNLTDCVKQAPKTFETAHI